MYDLAAGTGGSPSFHGQEKSEIPYHAYYICFKYFKSYTHAINVRFIIEKLVGFNYHILENEELNQVKIRSTFRPANLSFSSLMCSWT
jgi:hypothetical protein